VESVPVSGLGYEALSTFSQFFDEVSPIPTGWLPDGWANIVQAGNTTANVNVRTTTPFSPPNQLTFASGADLNAQLFLVSPYATNFSESRIYFTARMGLSSHVGKVQVGYLTDRFNPTTFVSAADVNITGSWQLYSVELANTGVTFPENAFIGIKYVPEVTNRLAVIDNVIFEPTPTQPIFNANKMDFDFGNTTWMYESSTQLLQIYNSGPGQLRINESGVQLAGNDPDYFSVEYPEGHTWPIALGFGQAINLTLRFSPDEGRTYDAMLNITDNVTSKAVNTITLTGIGYDAMIEPGFSYDFIGTYPPKDWRRQIGLFGVEPITLTTNTFWAHRKFANELSLPANNSAGINVFGTARKHWLMTPPVNLGDGSQEYQLEFDLALTAKNTTSPANFGTNQKLLVVISTDGGQTWETTNVLQEWNSSTTISNTGERVFINLLGYTGRVMFGFYVESTVTGGDVDVFIRNVAVTNYVPLVQLPLMEDFESRSFPPQYWSTYNVDGVAPEWALSTDYNHTPGGEKSAHHTNGTEAQDGWLVTPLMQIPAQGPVILKFWSLNNNPADYGKNSVWVSTGSSNPADGEFVEVWTTQNVTNQWVETMVDLSDYTNHTIYVGFRYEGADVHQWFVDDIELYVDTSPVIAVSPETIERSQVAGVTSQSVVTVTNNGIDNLVYEISPEYLSGSEGWLSIDPATGDVQGGGFSQNHSIAMNSEGLEPGIYTANLLINSNDPANPVVSVFVSLSVSQSTVVEVKTMINSSTFPLDISQDGKYVAITGFGGGSNYLWSEEAGLQNVTGEQVSINGVADDGTIVGSFKDPAYIYNGSMVQVSGTWDPITKAWTFLGMNPDAPNFFSTSYQTGYGITADGQMVVGMQYLAASVYKAFKWTNDDGYNTIGASYPQGNRPNGVNKTGSVIYGWAQTPSFSRSPAIWINDNLILLAPTLGGEARHATPSGNYVTGSAGTQGFLRNANGDVTFFSNKLNPQNPSPTTVLEDGTIFGFYGSVPPTNRRAFVRYTDDTQITFNEYALQRGLADAYDWVFHSINAATPDGTKFIGSGENPQGELISFLIDFDVETPAISINPEELTETILPGETSQQALTIENTGSADLDYNAIIVGAFVEEKRTRNQVPEGKIQSGTNMDISITKTNGSEAPDNRSPYSYVLNYDGANANAIGLTAGGEFNVAARYPADMVYLFEGATIQSVQVYIGMLPTRTILRIWGPGTTTSPGELIYQQPFVPVANSWNNITLNTPLELTGEDIWVGYNLENDPQVFPAGIDGGPGNPNGDFISNDGITWERLSNYGFNANWNIRSLLQLPTLEWISLSPDAGMIEPGQTETIQVSYDATNLEEGIYNANIVVFSNDKLNEVTFVPVELNVTTQPCPSPWEFMITGTTHTISIPMVAAPEIFGTPLMPFDWIGVFYLNEEGEATCAGAVQWNGESNVALIAYGDDPTTPEKDGFADGEAFSWKLNQCGSPMEYDAYATYSTNEPNQGYFAELGLSALTSLQAAYVQNYVLTEGWNSISTYLNPAVPAVIDMFQPIVNDLTIVSNLTTLYWPAQGVNSIINWNVNSGYVAKVTQDVDFVIYGESYLDGTLTLPAGWSYLPVLSSCEAAIGDVFAGNIGDVIFIQELISTNVYWPAYEIFTLETFEPGKAYRIKLAAGVTVSFPECTSLKSQLKPQPTLNKTETAWGAVNLNPVTQTTVITAEALAGFNIGDMIGAFDGEGNIYGYIQFAANNQNQTITLFGDDITATLKQGFAQNEQITFKLYRPATSEIFEIEAIYDENMNNSSGLFMESSLAAIINLKLKSTGTEMKEYDGFEILPNPTSDFVQIKFTAIESQNLELVIYDMKGNMVIQRSISGTTTLDVRPLQKGVYVVFVSNSVSGSYNVKRLIVK